MLMVAGLGNAVSAQTSQAINKISVGADVVLPTGDLSAISGVGFGGSVSGELNVVKNLNLTASAGYLNFSYKKVFRDYFKAAGVGNMAAIPVKGGAKYYFGQNFYGAAELGAAFSTGEGSETAFIYAPTLGTSFSVSPKSSLDLGIRYESWSSDGTSSFLGLRAAFAFGL